MCQVCGSGFEGKLANGLYCGATCRNRADKARRKADGRWDEYRRRPHVRVKRNEKILRVTSCSVCGASVVRAATPDGRRPACSQMCRTFMLHDHWPTSAVPLRHRSRVVSTTCAWCGDEVLTSPGSRRKYCGTRCSRRRKSSTRDAKKRARWAVRLERISRSGVLARDSYACKLCDEPLAMHRQVPHPLAPTLDHVIPLAKGGDHADDNLQAAHFICNVLKNDGKRRRDITVLVTPSDAHAEPTSQHIHASA